MASLTPMGSVTPSGKPISWPIENCDFLRGLPLESLADFESFAWLSAFRAGAKLFTEGQAPAHVFILLHGEVRLSISSVSGRRFILHIARPGEILGLACALSGHPCEMTAEARHLCYVARLSSRDFVAFLGRYPHLLESAVRALSLNYQQACTRLRTIGTAPVVAAKLARLLLEWSAEGNRKEPNSFIHVPLTHSEIGECIGASRETVTRVLARFQRQGMIQMQDSTLKIIDWLALEECAGGSTPEQNSAHPPAPILHPRTSDTPVSPSRADLGYRRMRQPT